MKNLIILIALALISQGINSQTLKGKITDESTKSPLVNAAFVINDTNGEYLKSTITNDDGYYEINISSGNYKLHVSHVGYKPYVANIEVIKDIDKTIDISMVVDETMLEEVVIVAEKTTVEQFIDKKVINVGNDLLSGGGSAATILSQLSEVRADETGSISLRGSKNVNVLINGKPSPLSNSEVLQQIPASEINKIEVITSPSAKYRANGITGIINIITKRNVRKGLSLSTNTGVNSLLGHDLGVNINYGKNKINYRIGGSYRKQNMENTSYQERIGTRPFIQNTDFLFDGKVKRFNTGIDWFIDKKNEFSTDLNYTYNTHTLSNENEFEQEGVNLDQKSIGEHIHETLEINTNYRHKFNKEDSFLEIDFQVSDNGNNLKGFFIPNQNIQDNETDNSVLISNLAIDYTNPISKKFEVEMGYLWSSSKLNNKLFAFNIDNEIANQEDFINREKTHALYGLTRIYFSKLDLQVGLRGELYERNADIITSNVVVENSFANLFPSLHLKYKLKKKNSLVFGYNRRTSRPSLYQVNPIVSQVNEFMISQGNPSLIPEFSNNFEISGSFEINKLSFMPSIFYRLKESIIVSNFYLNNEGTTVSTFSNQGSSNAYGTELNINYKPIKWLNSHFDFNYYLENLNHTNNTFVNDLSLEYGFSFRNQIKATKKLKFDVSWIYYGPEEGFFESYEKTQKIDFATRYEIFKNANLNLRVTDIFNTLKWKGNNVGDGFVDNFEFKPQSRMLYLSFSYYFNSGEEKERNKKDREYKSGVLE